MWADIRNYIIHRANEDAAAQQINKTR